MPSLAPFPSAAASSSEQPPPPAPRLLHVPFIQTLHTNSSTALCSISPPSLAFSRSRSIPQSRTPHSSITPSLRHRSIRRQQLRKGEHRTASRKEAAARFHSLARSAASSNDQDQEEKHILDSSSEVTERKKRERG